jgi:hypothetical protein
MQNNYSHIFSSAELKYLKTEADEYGWYVWTETTRPIIEGLCARRLMAANGDFKVIGKPGERHANLAGHASPAHDTILRYYELVGVGRIAFQALRNGPEASRPTSKAGKEEAVRHTAHT